MNQKMRHLRRPRGYTKFIIDPLTNKDIIMKTTADDIMYAGEEKEFFYCEDDSPVPEGQPVGVDIETAKGIELVLFSNIYWSPQYEEE